jgi:MYXO-CTERM domain-containing protein
MQYIDAIQQLKVNETDYVPLWITEFGWQSPMPLSDAQQAANLDTALTTFESRGDVARTFVFKVDDYANWGIFDGSWNAKPAVATYTKHDMGCTHIKPQPLDAGAEGGTPGNDAGAKSDAGGGGRDGGNGGDASGMGADASGPGVDAGGSSGGDDGGGNGATAGAGSSSGCGCRTTRSDSSSAALGAIGVALAIAIRRRRR